MTISQKTYLRIQELAMLYPENSYLTLLLDYIKMANDLRRICEESIIIVQDVKEKQK